MTPHDAIDTIDVRPITTPDIPDWLRALKTGFLRAPTVSEQEAEARAPGLLLPRTLGAFDGDRCVATFRSFPQELTVVGGAAVPADAISNVTVSPTHRRRGLLTRMMAADLAAAKERGDVVATLIAAEYPIYGRYGFGPVTTSAEWTVDVPRTGLDPRWAGPDDGGRIDLEDAEDVRKMGPDLHERFRRGRPGAVSRDDRWWQVDTGLLNLGGDPWKEPFYAAYRSASGEVEGLVAYESDDNWGDTNQPQNTAEVRWLLAVTPAAERALWRYLCSIDWIARVKTGRRAPDDLLPHFLPDPRAARITTQSDWLWVRILDVVRALEARTYGAAGTLVLEVLDGSGPAGGRYRLQAAPDGTATCSPTAEEAQLTLSVADLATLWLGDESAVRLVALGRVRERQEGAASVADALLRTSRRPWCPDIF
ncbi:MULTISPECIES: GNAT family N-acetyltransferase [unclassified Streptomyces]|uniref:GNAT family N-acetyltransferase n=1 Tax=unclassified Streptomyces TaxID=2593676 RepID=UPI00225BFD88|nr:MULTISPECIES: GNAT family N-acetyltransferase [unclassified Streptomyces]MCX4990048.1 GNAT family N-acetyltransferase [Streptomyces sp. NBC_00568]MCX5004722.1 GNAT family N-acetyltransferase [Streptomyces sp. NBC_00638]